MVCQEGISEDSNQIVFCDGNFFVVSRLIGEGCEIAVHQNCYGIRCIPQGVWYCAPCAELGPGSGLSLSCSLCGLSGGSLKRETLSNDWVHVQCAM